MGKSECGSGKRDKGTEAFEWGSWNADVGMRPLASPSCRLYEPEAAGTIGASPPACKPMKPAGWKRARRAYASESAI